MRVAIANQLHPPRLAAWGEGSGPWAEAAAAGGLQGRQGDQPGGLRAAQHLGLGGGGGAAAGLAPPAEGGEGRAGGRPRTVWGPGQPWGEEWFPATAGTRGGIAPELRIQSTA